MNDLKRTLQACTKVIARSKKFLAKAESEVQRLKDLTNQPGFWEQNLRATQVAQQLALQEKKLKTWQALATELASLNELLQDCPPESLQAEIENFAHQVQVAKLQLFLTGEFDNKAALLSVKSGAGGVDAFDCTEMILRMFLRFAEQQNWSVKILERTPASLMGLKSATIEIEGESVFGLLKSEQGGHRIVRRSPFNAANSRETSFVQVAVWPKVTEAAEVEIAPAELKMETFCASGAGGQHVNRTESAVRLTHLPTGLTASCQNERSQWQNRLEALTILQGKVALQRMQERENQKRRLRGKLPKADFGGDTIRSYVLDDHRVKDLRTGFISHDSDRVLAGNLADFIEAFLLQNSTE